MPEPKIAPSKVRNAKKGLNNNKSPGPDKMHREVLKLIGNDQLGILTRLLYLRKFVKLANGLDIR